MKQIKFPTENHKNYINYLCEYCKRQGFSLILKGSLATGTAKTHSDIDLILMGKITNADMDHIISQYDNIIMTNYTENPKGIFILIYENGLCIDLDLRDSIVQDDLEDAIILNREDSNFAVSKQLVRKQDIVSKYLPERPEWYKILRIVHRGLIKYLCENRESADVLLSEIKESLDSIGINNLEYAGSFKDDIYTIFSRICKEYDVNCEIKSLFLKLLEKSHKITKDGTI